MKNKAILNSVRAILEVRERFEIKEKIRKRGGSAESSHEFVRALETGKLSGVWPT